MREEHVRSGDDARCRRAPCILFSLAGLRQEGAPEPVGDWEASMRNRSWTLATFLALGAAGVVSVASVWAAKPIERLTAFAVDMSNLTTRARTGTVDIAIERWSTDQERD